MKSFKQFLEENSTYLLNEKIYGNTGWVYHRTRTNPETSSLSKLGIKPSMNKSALFGSGLYASYDIDLLLTDYAKKSFGDNIIRGKINLSNFIILSEDIYNIMDNKLPFQKYLESLGIENHTSDNMVQLNWKRWKQKGHNGIVMANGIVVIWNRRNFIPSSYSLDDGKSWNKIESNIENILRIKNDEHDNDPQREKNILLSKIRKRVVRSEKNVDGEIVGYDKNGNKIYSKYPDGGEEIWLYDDNKNLIYKQSGDYFEEAEFDMNNKKIYERNSDGVEIIYKYDKNGNNIYMKSSDGFEQWREFDENGKATYLKNTNGVEMGRRKTR